MSHSKRNTTRAVFTSYERDCLKGTWGTQSARLSSNSFLPFGSCQLCLLPSVNPVACPSGDLFCRECAITNLLAQRKEIKRLGREYERLKDEEEERKAREEEEAQERAVREFEEGVMGVGGSASSRAVQRGRGEDNPRIEKPEEEATSESKGTKRKFQLDASELHRIAQYDTERAKRLLSSEKAAQKAHSHLPSFWVPAETPDTDHSQQTPSKKLKQHPTCPASDPEQPHSLSLKSLTTVNFTEEMNTDTDKMIRTCPSCRKALSNATKAVLAIPCGHVLCKPCVGKFLKPDQRHHRDAHDALHEKEDAQSIHCYVCDADLTAKPEIEGKKSKKEKKEKKEKEGGKEKEKAPRPGLVDIRCEGTGFAGGGKNMVKREGVAFQV